MKNLKNWLEFTYTFTEKEIKIRYKNLVLGFLWVILSPLLQMAIIASVFSFFIPVAIDNYYLFVFSGIIFWKFFSDSVNKATTIIRSERNLIQKAKFPRESLVVSVVLSQFFHLVVSMALLVVALVADKVFLEHYGFLALISYLLRMSLLLPLSLWFFVVTTGFCLLFSALNVRFRDVQYLVSVLLQVAFYASPIVYTINLLPRFIHPLLYLNPLTGIFELLRLILFTLPLASTELHLFSFLSALSVIWVGVFVFIKESGSFDDWV